MFGVNKQQSQWWGKCVPPSPGSGQRARRSSDHGKAIAGHRRPQIPSFTGFYPVENEKGRPEAALTPRTARFYLIAVTFDFLPIPNIGAFALIALAKSSSSKWP